MSSTRLRIVEAIVRGPGLSKAGRSPLGVAMPKTPSPDGRAMSAARRRARLAVRKVIRDARDKNKWRKIVRFRLWMPVVLQILLIVSVALVHRTRGSPASSTAPTSPRSSSWRCRWSLAAIAQTHALLVGYLDLSVGGDDQPRGRRRLLRDRRRSVRRPRS